MSASASPPPTAGSTGPSRRRVVTAVIGVLVVVAAVIIVKLASGDAAPAPSAGQSPSPTAASPAASPTPSLSQSVPTAGTPAPGTRTPAAASTATPTAGTSAGPIATPTAGSSARASARASAGTSAGSTATPTPSVTTQETPQVLQTHRPVPMKTAAPFGDGVTATIVSVVPVQSIGKGPGEISGPAIKVTISLENGTNNTVPVNQVTVNASYGTADDPSIPILGDPSAKPFTGTVASGASTRGTYIFDIPTGDRSRVTVSVSHAALSPIVVFRGAVK